MQFNLILFEGTDTIKFGMTREEIQAILKVKSHLVKSVADTYDAEYYPKICKVFYEPNEKGILVCAEIEFYMPVKVFLDGIQLIGKSLKEIEDLFRNKFDDFTNEAISGPRSDKYGIAVYIPNTPRGRNRVETVTISREGYGKQQREFYKKAYDEKYPIEGCIEREYICLNCKSIINSKTPIVKCPKCNILMIPK